VRLRARNFISMSNNNATGIKAPGMSPLSWLFCGFIFAQVEVFHDDGVQTVFS
jgi:hypothetical protein